MPVALVGDERTMVSQNATSLTWGPATRSQTLSCGVGGGKIPPSDSEFQFQTLGPQDSPLQMINGLAGVGLANRDSDPYILPYS
jgi:hypothetical protein